LSGRGEGSVKVERGAPKGNLDGFLAPSASFAEERRKAQVRQSKTSEAIALAGVECPMLSVLVRSSESVTAPLALLESGKDRIWCLSAFVPARKVTESPGA